MKPSNNITRNLLCILTLLFLTPVLVMAQVKYHGAAIKTSINGTSSLHDWEMTSEKGQCDAAISIAGTTVTFAGLSFAVPAETYKSGHGAMDKNTYKALNTSKYANITFVLSSVTSISTAGLNTYTFKGVGKLTISGTTKTTDIAATLKYNPTDKSFTCTGSKTFKMTEYSVKPPTVMFGAIKTGDEVTIKYNLVLKS